MALKELIATKDDFRDMANNERRRANRLDRALRNIAVAKSAPADRLRELAADAVRKKKPSAVRRRKPK